VHMQVQARIRVCGLSYVGASQLASRSFVDSVCVHDRRLLAAVILTANMSAAALDISWLLLRCTTYHAAPHLETACVCGWVCLLCQHRCCLLLQSCCNAHPCCVQSSL
jgi:hypothetical protein